MCGENLRRTWRPVSGYKEMTKKKWYYSEFRPWTDDSKQENLPGKWHPKVRLEPIEEWTIFKGDVVSSYFKNKSFFQSLSFHVNWFLQFWVQALDPNIFASLELMKSMPSLGINGLHGS